MSEAHPPVTLQISLPPEQFEKAFPFHLALDRQLRVLQAGASLARICPDLKVGARLGDLFRPMRPEGSFTFAWILEHKARFFLFEHRASALQLRGEFVLLPEVGQLLFLGSPWFTDAAEIARRGLGFEDFALHDSVVDLLQVFQANKIALGDAKRLAEKLTAQRAELRVANERLRQQEAETRKLALIAARTDNAVVLTDNAGLIVWVNEGFTRLTGYTPAEVLGKKPGAMLQGPGTDPHTIRRIGERIRQGQGFIEEVLNYGKDGRTYWLAIEVQPIFDEAGLLTNFMAIETDITARRATQQRLAIQFEVSRTLATASDLSTAMSQVLEAICRNLGWQFGALWRRRGDELHLQECWHPPEAQLGAFIDLSRKTSFASGAGLPGRVWVEQQPVWVADVTKSRFFIRSGVAEQVGLRGAFGIPVMVHGVLWGVVEFFSSNIEQPNKELLTTFGSVGNQLDQFIVRCEAEEALRKTSTLQNAILGGANYSIISTTPDGTIQLFNATAERMLGYTAEEVVGRQTPALFHVAEEIQHRAQELTLELGREVKPGFEAFVAKAELGQPDEREWSYIRKDGNRVPVLLSVTALFDEQDRISGYLGVASDLTLRQRDEEKMRSTLSELERFNRVMLQRETRVIELKREINRLCAANGQPPAYKSVLPPPSTAGFEPAAST